MSRWLLETVSSPDTAVRSRRRAIHRMRLAEGKGSPRGQSPGVHLICAMRRLLPLPITIHFGCAGCRSSRSDAIPGRLDKLSRSSHYGDKPGQRSTESRQHGGRRGAPSAGYLIVNWRECGRSIIQIKLRSDSPICTGRAAKGRCSTLMNACQPQSQSRERHRTLPNRPTCPA